MLWNLREVLDFERGDHCAFAPENSPAVSKARESPEFMANLYENVKSQSGSRRWFRRAASPTGRSDPPTSEGDHCLGVPLALSPLTVVESPGLRDATQAGERRLVEDPLENPVAAAPLAVVSNPLTGVAGGRH